MSPVPTIPRPKARIACGAAIAVAASVLGIPLVAGPASAAPSTAVSIPAPGSFTASPSTNVELRSLVPTSAAPDLVVTGSKTGAHPGSVTVHPDQTGVTFDPDTPFQPGETVTVASSVAVRNGDAYSFSFTVATPGSFPGITPDGEIATPQTATANRQSAAAASATATAAAPGGYTTRPDLRPPSITVPQPPTQPTAPGLLFATPNSTPTSGSGVLIYDNSGEVVWFKPIADKVVGDASVQTLNGQQVLTWFEGTAPYGVGNYRGEYVVADSTYQEIGRIRMGNGYQADIHDLQITPQGTALMMAYNPVLCDGVALVGCTPGATILDGVVQEVDIATGTVLFEWHALDHMPISDSYEPTTSARVDFIHLNSVDLDTDGNFLLSARHTSSLYKVDRTTGDIIFTLGGKDSDFTYVGEGNETTIQGPDYQHDFRARGNGTYSYFDNGNRRDKATPQTTYSRGAIVTLDLVAKTATYTTTIRHTPDIFGPSQGKFQQLPGGGNLVGWGGLGVATEYNAAGTPIFEARIDISAGTYRTVRQPWTGSPLSAPDLAVTSRSGTGIGLAVSWNGDTRAASWQVLSGPTPTALTNLGAPSPRTGFETTLAAGTTGAYVSVQALDAGGVPIPGGRSAAVRGGAYFTEAPALSVTATYKPLVGDFGGTRNDDILYYAAGAGSEFLHLSDGQGGFTSVQTPPVNGAYSPLVGDFVGDERDEVLWRASGSTVAVMWRFDRAPRTAAPVIQSGALKVPATVTSAVLMDNRPNYGGGKDEVFFYAGGSAPDRVDRFTWVSAKPLTTISRTVSVNGTYRPVAGDFDGNGLADVMFYAPGTTPDSIWLSTGGFGGSTGHRVVNVTASGTYAIMAADVAGDARQDELLFYSPGSGGDVVWSLTPADTILSANVSNSATGTAYELPGPEAAVMLWSGGSPAVWQFGPGVPAVTPSGNTALGAGYVPLVGDFVGAGGTSSVVWYAPGATPEVLFAG